MIKIKQNLIGYFLRHRFNAYEVFKPDGITRKNAHLLNFFPREQIFDTTRAIEEQRKLTIALILGAYMSSHENDENELFSKFCDLLTEEEWKFALKFCPYHRVLNLSQNLPVIQSALDEAYLGLKAASAGMEVAAIEIDSHEPVYDRESSKAMAHLLNFVALYSTCIDICRRIKSMVNLEGSQAYSRAINKFIKKNAGPHSFIKGYRNFQLHYQIVKPGILITLGEHSSTKLTLSSMELLHSGFAWKRSAKEFLLESETLDLLSVVSIVLTDIKKVIQFHVNLVERNLPKERNAYLMYTNVRAQKTHLSNAQYDKNQIFGKSKPLLNRLVDRSIIDSVLHSSISDSDVKNILYLIGNRYKNLPEELLNNLILDIEQRLKERQKLV